MSSEERKTEFNDSISERKIQSFSKRKEKKAMTEKKNPEKAYFLQELIFSFQTKSRAKYTKVQVVLKQVYVGEVYEEQQKSYGKSSQHIAHSSKRI